MDMLTLKPVTVFRVPEGAEEGAGKQAFSPPVGSVFAYEDSEVAEINKMTPGALEAPPVVLKDLPAPVVVADPLGLGLSAATASAVDKTRAKGNAA